MTSSSSPPLASSSSRGWEEAEENNTSRSSNRSNNNNAKPAYSLPSDEDGVATISTITATAADAVAPTTTSRSNSNSNSTETNGDGDDDEQASDDDINNDNNNNNNNNNPNADDDGKAEKNASLVYRMAFFAVLLTALLLAGLIVIVFIVTKHSDSGSGKTLEHILAAGTLDCGVVVGPRQAEQNARTGEWSGFNVDLCRAVAVAIFGMDGHVTVKPVTPSDWFQNLNNDTVQLLSSGTTHTMERQIHEPNTKSGFSFSTPYMYAGLGFGGLRDYVQCAENTTTTGSTCSDLRICVVSGTTHEALLIQDYGSRHIVPLAKDDELYANLQNNACNVIAGEQIGLATKVVQESGYTGDYIQGNVLLTKEPLCLVTRNDDPVFTDFVTWVLQALMHAEVRSITQSNSQLIGQHNEFGGAFATMFQDVVGLVGNYGEMFNRTLGTVVSRLTINQQNTGHSGLMYAIPFGDTSVLGPDPSPGKTLDLIRQAGQLKCGITQLEGIALWNGTKYVGFDVDFCRALSAAIFQGDPDRVNYTTLAASDQFLYLDRGDVHVLSRRTTWTLQRDVLEPTTDKGYSFSPIVFFDELTFGIRDPNETSKYNECLNKIINLQNECQDLKICVANGTTYSDILSSVFPNNVLVPKPSGDAVLDSFRMGDCNVFAGGILDVVGANLTIIETGLSNDPIALVTKQDDPEWSAFVFWVVSSLTYAEEHGITKETANDDMPLVNLFGSNLTRMFRDAVAAVGNYGDIYDRNLETIVPRQNRNKLNVFPFGPELFELPGFE